MTMTLKLATEIAQKSMAAFSRHNPADGVGMDILAALHGTGWEIPAGVYTDGDDQRTIASLAKWIRRNAVSENTVGRPAELTGGKRVNVYLDAASLARAAELGCGNVSEGIRAALRA